VLPEGAIAALIGLVVLVGAAAWWLLITTEGVYLGRRVVVWLYDVYAARYDRIKQFDPTWEAETLSTPLIAALTDVPCPLILDVATGTGRLPALLYADSGFAGRVVGLDASRRMLRQAAGKLAGTSAVLIRAEAGALPFPDAAFDAVTCLEALEFMPDANCALAEMVRVARPGAVILITNRRGRVWDMPGRLRSRAAMVHTLRDRFGLENVTPLTWQVDYDLIWAWKPSQVS
jgi:ubiquinone/menaquinone biosynthesis C-methylase UbiE